jgi:hypothetical protein
MTDCSAFLYLQMIIHIPFTQQVKIRSMLIKPGTLPVLSSPTVLIHNYHHILGHTDLRPTRLKVYANTPTIVDFSDAETRRPHLDIALLEETGVVEYPLRVAAPVFSGVWSLSVFLVGSYPHLNLSSFSVLPSFTVHLISTPDF